MRKMTSKYLFRKLYLTLTVYLFDLHHPESGKICNFIFINYVAQLNFISIVREFCLLYFVVYV